MHIFFLVFSMPRRGSILDSRSDRSTSSKSFQKEIKKKEKEIKKKDDFIFEMKRQMDSMKEYLMNNLGYHGGHQILIKVCQHLWPHQCRRLWLPR